MSFHRTWSPDILAELIEDARWVENIGEAGRKTGPLPGRELDAMLEALVQAQQLRRRWASELARERALGEGCGWAEGREEGSILRNHGRRSEDREAS
jgi:hypothetical protein